MNTMRHYIRFLLLLTILSAIFMLTACHDDEDTPIEEATEQTVIFFMPWSTNMTPYFKQNIAQHENPIENGNT